MITRKEYRLCKNKTFIYDYEYIFIMEVVIMPNLDGTGPDGIGQKTGRQRGNCEGAVGRGLGPCGRGLRRGYGRGFRRASTLNLSKEEQKKIMEAELKEIEAEKQEIERRLKEM